MTEIKKAPKKSFPTKKTSQDAKKKEAPKKPTTRMGRLLRGPLVWIVAAIFAVKPLKHSMRLLLQMSNRQ